jgi:hypothetical protein
VLTRTACQSLTSSVHTYQSKCAFSVHIVHTMYTVCTLRAHLSAHRNLLFMVSVEMVCTRTPCTVFALHWYKLHKFSSCRAGSRLVVLLLGERMVGGPYHCPRVFEEEFAPFARARARAARPPLLVTSAPLKGRCVCSQGGQTPCQPA